MNDPANEEGAHEHSQRQILNPDAVEEPEASGEKQAVGSLEIDKSEEPIDEGKGD